MHGSSFPERRWQRLSSLVAGTRRSPSRPSGGTLLACIAFVGGLAISGLPALSAELGQPRRFGSSAGDRYRKGGRDTEAWIIGFERTKGFVMGKPMIGMLEPVYTRAAGVDDETEDRIVAREGYVVAEVELDVDTFLRAVRVKFHRLKDGRIDPSDSYHSRWIGKRKNKRTTTLPGAGQKIVGIFGTADEAIRSIGLLVGSQEAAAVDP